jgi:hypothetical protein
MPLLPFQHEGLYRSNRFDCELAELADRHYSRQKIGSPQFIAPGRNLVYRDQSGLVVFVWLWQAYRDDGEEGYCCSIFRNETPRRSSEIILEAERWLFVSGARRDEYKRLHKLLTGVSAKMIWESLRDCKSLDPLRERTPDEFHAWLRHLEIRLRREYQIIEDEAIASYREFDNRKDAAMYFTKQKHPHILFSKMDGKDYSRYIWQQIKPKGECAFRCDIDI